MKRECIHLPGGMTVETGTDWNGRFYIGYSKGASVFVRCQKQLKQFLKLPAKTPSRDSLDGWLASLPAVDLEG